MTTTHTDPQLAEIWRSTVEAINALDDLSEALDDAYEDILRTEGATPEAVAILQAENEVLSTILRLTDLVRGTVGR